MASPFQAFHLQFNMEFSSLSSNSTSDLIMQTRVVSSRHCGTPHCAVFSAYLRQQMMSRICHCITCTLPYKTFCFSRW